MYRDDIAELTRQNLNEQYFESYKNTYLAMFEPLDLLFLGLGVVTSYQIAARGRKKKELDNELPNLFDTCQAVLWSLMLNVQG